MHIAQHVILMHINHCKKKTIMTTDYRYTLETPRVTGRRQQKTRCPHCGRKSFVRYVDTQNGCQYIADEVGKCDHEHSCGYHYKPKEYFDDHVWMKEKPIQNRVSVPPKPKPTPPLQPLPMELVSQTHSPASTFWQWFSTDLAQRLGLDTMVVQQVYEDYRIGADEKGNVIWWQIDEKQQVRSGKIMRYKPDGHRVGNPNWVHSEQNFKDKVPEGFVLYQCLFGQHLLLLRTDAQVCLVESEKTAVIMAASQPQYLWLATGGSNALNADKLECLRGRRLTLFPDSGCLQKWQKVMQQTNHHHYTIFDQMEQYPANTDLADLLLEPP